MKRKAQIATVSSVVALLGVLLAPPDASAQRPIRGAVPIPGTLLIFTGGFVGLASWMWARARRRHGAAVSDQSSNIEDSAEHRG